MTDVVVVGGGVAGLTAGFDLAVAGHRVTVLEGSESFGGTVSRAVVGGIAVDVGAESFALATGTVQQLITDLGLADQMEPPQSAPAWVRHTAGAAPLPAGGWMGIPARPWARDVRRVIGWPGAARASLDRILPARVGRSAATLGELVRGRMGRRVVERLVEPVVGGVYSTPPYQLSITQLPLRAREALSGSDSLGSATQRIRGGAVASGSQVAGLKGGMFTLVEALVGGIRDRGGQLLTGVRVDQVAADGDGWTVAGAGRHWSAAAVVLAGPAEATSALLGGPTPSTGPGEVLLCTLVVDSPALDAAPRGSGMLVAADVPDIGAKAMTHATAKWRWLTALAGPGRHVVRLSYGRVGDRLLPDPRAFPLLAVGDAGRLLGVPLHTDQVRGWRLDRWPVGGSATAGPVDLPASIAVTGGWVAGTGLAAVIGHARAAAARLTSQLAPGSTTVGPDGA